MHKKTDKIQYQSNRQLSTIKNNYPGNKLINDEFVNVGTKVSVSILHVVKWYTIYNPQWIRKPRDNFKLKVVRDENFLERNDDVIIWLGHSSFFIRIAGISILTDPCYDHLPMVRRLVKLPFKIDLLKDLDYVLISHGHLDHFNKRSMQMILSNNPNVKCLVPLNMGIMIKEMSKHSYEEAGWYQQYHTSNNIDIIFLPARHWHKRGFMDDNRMLWGSFLIRSNNRSIYFAGDSAYGKHYQDIRKTIGPIEFCLMPISPYKPSNIMRESHIGPKAAVKAFHDLHGKYFIPMHHGTYDLAHESLGDPIRKIRKLNKKGKLAGRLRELKIGENFYM